MGYDISVLRAILRLARRRLGADLEQISLRVTGEGGDVRSAVRRLERAGLVARTNDTVRLTMAGLAVAVASVRSPARSAGARRASRTRAAAA